jgi:hypothetical protein
VNAVLLRSGLTAHLPYLLVMGLCGALCYVLAFLMLPLKALASESARWRQKLADMFARLGRARTAAPGATSAARVRSPALISAAVLLVGLAALGYKFRVDLGYEWSQWRSPETGHFAALSFEPRKLHHVFDVGVVDADGDGALDLFTANHNYRQSLLLGDGRGAFKDVLTEWGLDQNRDFPHWEQSFAAPTFDKPGLYIYWLGETLVLRTHGAMGPVAGTLKMFSAIGIDRSEGFEVQTRKGKAPDSPIAQTIIEFRSKGAGVLELQPPSRGVPTQIELAPEVDLSRVFVGRQRATPVSHSFSPFLRDRHGHAWADIDGDGRLDAYITRGGVGGTIRMQPGFIRDSIRDELMLSAGGPPYRDGISTSGIQKKDCSGRHADWVDIDGNGRLELFVNCQDRGRADGGFPKQLWRADAAGRYQDVATAVGLGLLGREIIDYVWTDVDGDGDIDLVTVEDKGFFVHLNKDGRFSAQLLHRPDFVRDDVSGLKTEVNNYWRFDSKLAASDFDNDGDIDLFCASKRGNLLLENQGGGRFAAVAPGKLGLPDSSLLGVWVDYDNDGLMDMHLVPQGLYRQTAKGRFVGTGLLAMRPHLYQAAVAHWFDIDNDGRRDAWLALNENPGLWRWWQRPFRDENAAHAWSVQAWRNLEQGRHWLQIDVSGGAGNRQAINARVTVHTPQGAQLQDVGVNDSSYFSQGHYRLYFGLGTHARADRVVVRWTDGRTLELRDVAADQRLRIDHPGTPQ